MCLYITFKIGKMSKFLYILFLSDFFNVEKERALRLIAFTVLCRGNILDEDLRVDCWYINPVKNVVFKHENEKHQCKSNASIVPLENYKTVTL